MRKMYGLYIDRNDEPRNKEIRPLRKFLMENKNPANAGFLFCGRKEFMPSSSLQRPSSSGLPSLPPS